MKKFKTGDRVKILRGNGFGLKTTSSGFIVNDYIFTWSGEKVELLYFSIGKRHSVNVDENNIEKLK
jgi:hypothetical protein